MNLYFCYLIFSKLNVGSMSIVWWDYVEENFGVVNKSLFDYF